MLTKDKDEYRIDIRLWDDIPEWAYQVMSGLELTRTYSIGIKSLQYIGDGPIEYVKECAKREFGFNTRKVRCVLDGDNVLIAKLFEWRHFWATCPSDKHVLLLPAIKALVKWLSFSLSVS